MCGREISLCGLKVDSGSEALSGEGEGQVLGLDLDSCGR